MLWCWQHPLVVKFGSTPSQEYCVKISLKSTQQLWNYATWQFSEGPFPSVVSKIKLKKIFLCTFSHATSGSGRPNHSSHSHDCKTPSKPTISFTCDTTEQYNDFQLFHKSVESWFTLQNIPAEIPEDPTAEPNSTRLEYVLNFLGNTGCRKFDTWKQTSTADEIAKKKKKALVFMDYLSSMMDHAVS